MRLLNIGYNLIPAAGGVHTAVLSFLTALSRYGHDARCISFTDRNLIPVNDVAAFSHIAIPPSRLGKIYGRVDKQQLSPLKREAEAADVIFIHLLYRHHVVAAAEAAKRYGKPLVLVPHGGLDPWVFTYRSSPKRFWLRYYRDLIFGANCTTLFATEAEMLKAGTEVRSSAERVIPWPVEGLRDNRRITSPPKDANPRRRLLFIGRLHPMKRILETIRALRKLGRTDWQLTIAGPPSAEVSIETLQAEAGPAWQDQIRYIGIVERNELGAIYANADALLLLSHRENFGYVVAEAMCEGLPVVISSDVDLSSLVVNTQSGLVKTVRNDHDISDVLRTLLDLSATELAMMGSAAAGAAQREFGFERFASSLNELVTDCVSRSFTTGMSA